uniref:Uncharacterized protein n=1 Tax=Arundo donax TaxID=35708 RepID=A0A0A8Z4B1_ARUDO
MPGAKNAQPPPPPLPPAPRRRWSRPLAATCV